MLDLVDQIIQFETVGFETEAELIGFFQELIDTGQAWQLQGSYGRAAMNLIKAGFCVPAETTVRAEPVSVEVTAEPVAH